jgi:hypothetical protein
VSSSRGQVAHTAFMKHFGLNPTWGELTPNEAAGWETAARAVERDLMQQFRDVTPIVWAALKPILTATAGLLRDLAAQPEEDTDDQ